MITENPIEIIKLNYDGRNVTVELNNEALNVLKRYEKPAKVVSIIGEYRTGKSYFANRLLGLKTGFPVIYGIDGITKGVWMW